VESSPGWADAWIGFDLDMQFKNRSINTIANRKCNVSIMAKHATADGDHRPGAGLQDLAAALSAPKRS
jgi:hypothetical protein